MATASAVSASRTLRAMTLCRISAANDTSSSLLKPEACYRGQPLFV